MSSDPAISVRGLTKRYLIGRPPEETTLSETLLRRLRQPLTAAGTTAYTALDDVSFDVAPGQVLGVLGRNGAGKSTLLKVLTRVTPPTAGEVVIRGRLGSLLEVGTGFHPELTGRENVYLNGAVLGMRSREVRRRFDEIVAFAGVEEFLDTPVKRYSSGMYVRLAFALAAHLDADVLLVDEVLAVGDQDFQRRSLSKMRDVAGDGRTVLLVSHQLSTLSTLCDTALYLDQGRVVHHGTPRETIDLYAAANGQHVPGRDLTDFAGREGTGEVRLVALDRVESVHPLALRWSLAGVAGPETVYVSLHVVDGSGTTLVQCDSRLVHSDYAVRGGGGLASDFVLRAPALKPGEYQVDFFVCTARAMLDVVRGALHLTVPPVLPYPQAAPPDATADGVVLADFGYSDPV